MTLAVFFVLWCLFAGRAAADDAEASVPSSAHHSIAQTQRT